MELLALESQPALAAVRSLSRVLDDLEQLLIGMNGDIYRARFAPNVSGSIGEHVRHCLDHVSALVGANPSQTLSYDRRHRGTSVETDLDAAIRQVVELRRALELASERSLDERIRVSSVISTSGETVTGWSTLGRELAFVLSHTIHHQAVIAVLLAVHGRDVPDRFGHSPSTPRRH